MAGLDILQDDTSESFITGLLPLAKKQCQLNEGFTDDDDYLTSVVIPGSLEFVEDHTARSLCLRTFREYFDGFPGQHMPIPYNFAFDHPLTHQFRSIPRKKFELQRSPIVALAQIQYIDQSGATQTLDPSAYYAASHRDPAEITRSSAQVCWPVPLHRLDTVWIDYTAGYRDPADETQLTVKPRPAMALQAMLLLIGHWYENRLPVAPSGVAELPYAVKNLLDRLRVYYQA
jgi:uncharacterized phiE125 gp8 family phage protein